MKRVLNGETVREADEPETLLVSSGRAVSAGTHR
jgi:hypothetical protein